MPYEEQRVRTKVYGHLRKGSPLLVPVPTTEGRSRQVLHWKAAAALLAMSAAVKQDLGYPLLVASGWREHRWEDREEYERVLIARYGSLERGRLFLAFDSPHETGLACDFGCGGLAPVSATIPQQRQTPLHHWLVANAWSYGWHPYKIEPWHWEYPIESLAAYQDRPPEEAA